jgi:cytochrome c oxidase subunit III
MSAVAATTDGREPSGRAPGAPTVHRQTPIAVGVVVWLASELMFFGGLFAAYFAIRAEADQWPPPGVHLEVWRAVAATVVLLLSSWTMHLSARAAEHGDRRTAFRWLLATFLLGAVFLVNLGFEWASLDFNISSHAYGSMYYLITGFHGLHLIGGLALMIAAAAAVSGRNAKVPLGSTFTLTSYYWHFVDIVWIGVFLTIFIIQ